MHDIQVFFILEKFGFILKLFYVVYMNMNFFIILKNKNKLKVTIGSFFYISNFIINDVIGPYIDRFLLYYKIEITLNNYSNSKKNI